MGRIGRIVKAYIDKLSGSGANAQHVAVEEFSGDERKAQVFGPCNEDFAPPESAKSVDIPIGDRGRGFLATAVYSNEAIEPRAIAGERRIYSTNQAGDTVMAEAFLKQDGTILIANSAASITIDPSGLISIASDGNTEITSAKTIINNNVDINGVLKVTNGMAITGGGITDEGVSIGKTHKHSGVTVGVGNTGNPI